MNMSSMSTIATAVVTGDASSDGNDCDTMALHRRGLPSAPGVARRNRTRRTKLKTVPAATPTKSPAAAAAAIQRVAMRVRDARIRLRRRDAAPAREADDSRGAADQFEAPGDVLLLRAQALGRKQRVDLGFRVRAERRQERADVGVAARARAAVGEMLRRRRIDGLAAPLGVVAVDERVVLKMRARARSWLPSEQRRSLRAARNRCTRTVDSLSPIIAPTSRGVQSP